MTTETTTGINARFGFALEYVSDIEAVKRFYTDVVGLKVGREHPTFVQFKDATGDTFAIASDDSIGGGTETELYWIVDDAAAAFESVSSQAEVCAPLSDKPFGKVFGIKDPARQPRYFVEFARNRPSKAVE